MPATCSGYVRGDLPDIGIHGLAAGAVAMIADPRFLAATARSPFGVSEMLGHLRVQSGLYDPRVTALSKPSAPVSDSPSLRTCSTDSCAIRISNPPPAAGLCSLNVILPRRSSRSYFSTFRDHIHPKIPDISCVHCYSSYSCEISLASHLGCR